MKEEKIEEESTIAIVGGDPRRLYPFLDRVLCCCDATRSFSADPCAFSLQSLIQSLDPCSTEMGDEPSPSPYPSPYHPIPGPQL